MITLWKRSTALAACAALSLGAAPAFGQTEMTAPEGADQPAAAGEVVPGDPQMGQAPAGDQAGDQLVARVGEKEIMQSDVIGLIEALPPEIQEQPEETLVPLAVEQLILRELLLDKARQEGLENDPDVEALMAGAGADGEDARENAMVQIWLDRELDEAVTDQAVEDTYETVQEQFGDDVPPMAELRPQLEEEVRRQAFLDLSVELQQDADVTLYGPDGQPIQQQPVQQ